MMITMMAMLIMIAMMAMIGSLASLHNTAQAASLPHSCIVIVIIIILILVIIIINICFYINSKYGFQMASNHNIHHNTLGFFNYISIHFKVIIIPMPKAIHPEKALKSGFECVVATCVCDVSGNNR